MNQPVLSYVVGSVAGWGALAVLLVMSAGCACVDGVSGQGVAPEGGPGRCLILIGGQAVRGATHCIALPAEPTAEERYAAAELQRHLELIAGEALAVVPEAEAGERVPLVVGRCELCRRLAAQVDLDGLGPEGIHIKTAGPALVLAGNGRGVIYATYTFLEDYLGCRWFSEDCATWPTGGRLEVPELDRRYVPALEYRDICWPYGMPAQFAVRQKLNGDSVQADVPGGRISYAGFVHTFYALVPPQKYFDDHPEYFALVGGKRLRDGAQLCLTNPDVLRTATETVRQWIKDRPDARIVSVSQNDCGGWCECGRCSALAEAESSQAGPILHFVNAIADDIARDHPDVVIDTLAYHYSLKPPQRVRPRPNVCVRLCSIECIFSQPIGSHPFNLRFREIMEEWSKTCSRLYVWDYVGNYWHNLLPNPNLYVLKANINFFIRHGARGVFEEAIYYTRGAELAELRRYVLAKTLWDPSYDTDRAIEEFCRGYYGPAAPYVRRYVNLIHASLLEHPNTVLTTRTEPLAGFLNPALLQEGAALFDGAEGAVAGDPVLLRRVRVARLPVIYAMLSFADAAAWAEADGRLAPCHNWDVPALAREFLAICKEGEVTRVRESPLAPWAPLLEPAEWLQTVTRWPSETAVERVANPALEVAVLPALGGRIWRAVLRPSGRDLFLTYGAPGAWRPTSGGYEEYGGAMWRSPGWHEPYRVTERSRRAITVSADLPGGLRLARRIELDAQRPVLTIRSCLTNTSGQPLKACLRAHPEFELVFGGSTTIRARRPDGAWQTLAAPAMADPEDGARMWLEGERLPAGAWGMVDEARGLAIVNRFKPEQVARCMVETNIVRSRLNLELFSPEKTLPPGESIVLEHSYEVGSPGELFGEAAAP